MNCEISSILESSGVIHGFGMAGCTLPDYLSFHGTHPCVYFKTNQLHGDTVIRLGHDNAKDRIYEADAFITNEAGVVCYVRTADCVPILMHDPVRGVCAAVHSGWRGTALKVAAKTVDMFEKEFGSIRGDVRAVIGPCIGGDCYEVDADVMSQFSIACTSKSNLDLVAMNKKILEDCGVGHIGAINICSHCDTRFASYRRDKTETFRQVNFIVMV